MGLNLERIAMAATRGTYPRSFGSKRVDSFEYKIDASEVNQQTVDSPIARILFLLIMDPASLASAGSMLFPNMPAGEGVELAISANGEILNLATSKVSAALAGMRNPGKPVVIAPIVASYANHAAITLSSEDSLLYEFTWESISFHFAAILQAS